MVLKATGGEGGGGGVHVERLAAGADGALADGLLPALVAGQAVRLVVNAHAPRIVAVYKQFPASALRNIQGGSCKLN